MTLVELLKRTTSWLESRGVPSPKYDAECLISGALGLPRLDLYLQFDRPVTEKERQLLRPLVKRRGDREPLAWILGRQGFHEIDLAVGPGVLVPRPDTETLVNAALDWIPAGDDPVYVADIGCGSGAIGLAIAHARPQVRLYAIDCADEAIHYTRKNTEALGLKDRVAVLQGSLLDPIPDHRPIDWVVSNPPYIPSGQIDTLEPEVSKFEPRVALDGGKNGLEIIETLLKACEERVRCGALIEVGQGQAPSVHQFMETLGWSSLQEFCDLGQIERVVGGRKTSAL